MGVYYQCVNYWRFKHKFQLIFSKISTISISFTFALFINSAHIWYEGKSWVSLFLEVKFLFLSINKTLPKWNEWFSKVKEKNEFLLLLKLNENDQTWSDCRKIVNSIWCGYCKYLYDRRTLKIYGSP